MKKNWKVDDDGSVPVTTTKSLDEGNQNINNKDPLKAWVSLNTALSVSACCVTRIPNDVHSVTVVNFVNSKSPLSCDFIHLVVCLTTGPKPLPKWAVHIVRSRASSFKWEYPLLSLRSSSSFLHLLHRLPVTSIPSFIFLVVEGSFYVKCDQSSSPSVYLFHVGYSSATWL